jgi:tRNA/rRNA methyltransferase
MSISILLYQTENPENLGSIARAASNFNFHDILLVDPKCEITEKSRWLAKHGMPTLDRMKITDEKILESFDVLIATHGRHSTAYNLVRAPISPRQLVEELKTRDLSKARIGILFGPEGEGLSKEIIAKADIVLAIPTSIDNPSMNLAQSVTVVLYELSTLQGNAHSILLPYRPMNKEEHGAVLRLVDEVLDTIKYKTEKQKETQRLVWRRMIGKSMLTKRESYAVLGFLRGIKSARRQK